MINTARVLLISQYLRCTIRVTEKKKNNNNTVRLASLSYTVRISRDGVFILMAGRRRRRRREEDYATQTTRPAHSHPGRLAIDTDILLLSCYDYRNF